MNLTSCIKGGDVQGRPGWIIQFIYDEQTIERLKHKIPHTEREWRVAEKCWWISEQYEDELNKLFSNWYALAKMQGTLF